MNLESAKIEEIVKQVIANMNTPSSSAPKSASTGSIPKTAHVAMLTKFRVVSHGVCRKNEKTDIPTNESPILRMTDYSVAR